MYEAIWKERDSLEHSSNVPDAVFLICVQLPS